MDLLTSIKGFLETSLFPQLCYKSFKTFLKPLTTILNAGSDQESSLTGCQISEEDKARRGG